MAPSKVMDRNFRGKAKSALATKAALMSVMHLAMVQPLWRKASSNPAPVANPGSRWISRRYQLILSATGTAAANLTLGQIATALLPNFSGSSCTYKVKGISSWNKRLGGSLQTVVFLPVISNTADPSTTQVDVGTGTSLAGNRLILPGAIAVSISPSATATAIVASFTDTTAATTDVNSFIVQLTVDISV